MKNMQPKDLESTRMSMQQFWQGVPIYRTLYKELIQPGQKGRVLYEK